MNEKLHSFLLWISVPLCIVLAATGLQVFWPGIYSHEIHPSAAGALASDLVDLCAILPLLVVTTVLARRGSLRALLAWIGTLGFLTYNFVIYAFDVHFNAMFLAYCAVLSLSFYGLMGVREFLVPGEIAKVYRHGAPRISIAVVFLLLAVLTAMHEVKDIVSAIHAGQVPVTIAGNGQLTDPIHVLDLCFLLPAMVIAAVMLLRRKEMGFTLAPVLCVMLILISIEVIAIVAVSVKKGLMSDWSPAVSFAVPGALMAALLGWYFYPKRKVTEQAGMIS